MSAWRAVAFAVVVLISAPAGWAAPIDFLHVAAAVGGSTGGHYAIRFDDEVYHFQNDDLSLLAPQRDDDAHFRWRYTVLENRTIEVARIDVPADVFARLRDRFNTVYLAYKRQRALLKALQRDQALLDAVAESGDAEAIAPPLLLPAAGLYRDVGADGTPTHSRTLRRLRKRIIDRYGRDFLTQRIARVSERMRSLRPQRLSEDGQRVSRDRVPTAALRFSERYEALALQYVALEVLARAAALNPEVVRDPSVEAEVFALTGAERDRLARFADALEGRLVALTGSRREDRGLALLVGMARLDVLRRSVETGRLIFLDEFSEEANVIEPSSVRERTRFFSELATDARTRFATARARLFSAEKITEHRFSQLEAAGNRLAELSLGLRHGWPIRVQPGPLLPARPAAMRTLPLPALDPETLGAAAAAARGAEETYRSALSKVAAYHLTQRNCVTEIFHTIDETLGPDGSLHYLGGYIEPTVGLRFAPFVAHEEVLRTYHVVAAGEIPSYRRAKLAAMRAREGPLTTSLREANTLTSTLYRPNDTDSFFLFFTDDAVWPRPLYGLANLVAGAGQTLVGVFTSPFDRGRRIRAGAEGMVFSLPELALINVRKGTFEYGPMYAPHDTLNQPRHVTSIAAGG